MNFQRERAFFFLIRPFGNGFAYFFELLCKRTILENVRLVACVVSLKFKLNYNNSVS